MTLSKSNRKKAAYAAFLVFLVSYVVADLYSSMISSLTTTKGGWSGHLTTNNLISYSIRGTVCLLFTLGMEYYARYSHQYLWHNEKYLWSIHKTHHLPGFDLLFGVFELNDIFAVLNTFWAGPLLYYALQYQSSSLGNDFLIGFCVGVSIYGTAYIIVHDGIHHQRFSSGPLSKIKWLKQVADAHKFHHHKEMGAPFGLFLGQHEYECFKKGLPVPPMPNWLKNGLIGSTLFGVTCLALGL